MKTLLKAMQTRRHKISEDKLLLFEHIVQNHEGDECESLFLKAMEEHLTPEQRFRLWEQHGGCKGTGGDQERKAFALEHAGKPLAERLRLYRKQAVLNADHTITMPFACTHGYYKHAPNGKFKLSNSIETYFERCAGGRLYDLQKALGVKLKIKSVDVSPLRKNVVNPVVFTFEIEE
jgi:hypothetical protein